MFGDAIEARQLMSPIFESDVAGIPAFRRSLKFGVRRLRSFSRAIYRGWYEARIDCRRSDSNVAFAQARQSPACGQNVLVDFVAVEGDTIDCPDVLVELL
jgi:hypothetical protein